MGEMSQAWFTAALGWACIAQVGQLTTISGWHGPAFAPARTPLVPHMSNPSSTRYLWRDVVHWSALSAWILVDGVTHGEVHSRWDLALALVALGFLSFLVRAALLHRYEAFDPDTTQAGTEALGIWLSGALIAFLALVMGVVAEFLFRSAAGDSLMTISTRVLTHVTLGFVCGCTFFWSLRARAQAQLVRDGARSG